MLLSYLMMWMTWVYLRCLSFLMAGCSSLARTCSMIVDMDLNSDFTSKLDTSNLTEGRQPHHLGVKPNSLHVTPFMINKAKSPRAEPTEVFKFPSQRAGSDDGSVKQKNIGSLMSDADLKIAEPEFTHVNVLPPSNPKQD